MGKLIISSVTISSTSIEVQFDADENLKQYFRKFSFKILYEQDLTNLPECIAVIPFITNVLPLVWLTDSELIVPSLDKDFYDCIDSIKTGYKRMYPMLKFKGNVLCNNIVKNNSNGNKKGVLFSGGVDAYCTLLDHIDEMPDLITLRGSADFFLKDEKGWKVQRNRIEHTACSLSLNTHFITTNFLEFINAWDQNYGNLVHKSKDGWWHGFQHGIGIIGHVAPLAYILGYQRVYIASSYDVNSNYVCASDPIIDNQCRFCGTQIIHDSYNRTRQQKIKVIADFVKESHTPIELQVCLHEQKGKNCCACEKCYRTILGLLAEGVDPNLFGLRYNEYIQHEMVRFYTNQCIMDSNTKQLYHSIHDRFMERDNEIENSDFKKWFIGFDIDKINNTFLKQKTLIVRNLKREVKQILKLLHIRK